ncbi:hypothetical protein L1049_023356 [Liquidambar formosana]|uniref:Uncharacterized protein n=1 Tax=Liquidambar formosana TaxID=63359 RepID=A0AAP0RTS4_LIQFO
MTALTNSFVSIRNPQTHFVSGSSLKPLEQCFVNVCPSHLSLSSTTLGNAKPLTYRRPFIVRAGGDGGRPSSASAFVGGFVLGGIVVGATRLRICTTDQQGTSWS